MRTRSWLANLFCIGAVIFIVTSFFYPIWSLSAKAVQYETEFPEGLRVYAYLFRTSGDIYELNIMSKWIGAHFPQNVPEQVIFPALYGILALLCSIGLFSNDRKKRALKLSLILFILLSLAGVGSLQWRLYTFGHMRDPYPPADIPDFTIPILGSAGFWNWKITTRFDVGGYTMALAGILVALAFASAPKHPGKGSVTEEAVP
jgi:copper chaperone NosL